MTEPPQALAAALADRYRFERELGRGGMARVYLATDLKHQRPVAIKVLLPVVAAIIGSDRFLREIAFLASFQHPHIIPLFDSGEVNGEPFYVMPYVAGETLKERLARGQRLGIEEAVRITSEVASALEAAHRRGIVHRDIKPANILLSEGHALVADFGIAHAVAADVDTAKRLTTTGMSVGTPGYMSPEQVVADPTVDARSDVYALGAVTYEMLAGHPPIAGPSTAAVLARVLTDAPPPLTQVRRGTPPDVSDAVQRALAIERSDRFPTAAAFAQALERGSQRAAPVARGGGLRRRLLVGGVGLAAAAALWMAWRAAAPSGGTADGVRVAVLPFREAGDTTNPGFVLGLTANIRRDLASLPGVDIVAATSIEALGDSVRTPRYLQQQLGATHVLSGLVQWTRGADGVMEVAVTPEAVDLRQAREVATTGSLIAERADQLFRTQARVSAEIARGLGIPLSADAVTRLTEPPTRSRAAFEAYLEARVDPAGPTAALGRAVALDSSFATAWTELALAAVRDYRGAFQPAAMDLAIRAADRAMQLDSVNAATRVAALMVARHIRRDIGAAVRHATEAIRLAPGDPEVLTFAATPLFVARRFDEALAVARRAADLDPRNPSALARVSNLLAWRHDLVGAEDFARRALAINAETDFINVGAFWIPLMKGDTASATALARSLPSDAARSGLAVIADQDWLLGWALDSATGRLGAERFGRDGDALYLHLTRLRDAWRRADRAAAARLADSVVADAVPRVEATRGEERLRLALGYALALGGRCAEGIAQADTVQRTRSAWIDGFVGAGASLARAQILAVCGERRPAVALLDSLLRVPGLVTPAWLTIDPHFTALRSDSQFQALAGLARPSN